MASTLLVRDLLWRVSVTLGDNAPQFQQWTERELVHWLNDGQVAIAKFVPAACSRLDAVRLVPGTKQSIQAIPAAYCLPGDGSSPSAPIYGTQVLHIIRNMGADGLTPGKAITCVEREILDTNDDAWHTRTASTVRSFIYDEKNPRFFYVTPGVPASPQVWVDMSYTAQPIAIPNTAAAGSEAYLNSGSSTVTISIADEHMDDLVNYICARANLKDAKYAEPAKATFFANAFLNSLNAKVAALKGASPNIAHLPMTTPGP